MEVKNLIKKIDPAHNEVNVFVNKVIKVHFKEPVKEANNFIELRKGRNIIPITTKLVNHKLLTITPISSLDYKTKYILDLHTGFVADLDGNDIQHEVYTFTTTDYKEGISVITPSYKGEKHILKFLESMENQELSYDLFEIIIVINGELDETPQIVKGFKEKNPKMNIKVMYSEIANVSHARNIAIAEANRKYTTFIDDDDYVSPNYLKEFYENASENKLNLINMEKYWDDRFRSGEWEKDKGREQTLFHYKVLLQYMPKWLKNEISYNKMGICDLGCGLGDGADLFKKYFIKSEVEGVDFSKTAIEKAKNDYLNVSFINSDIDDFDRHYDVIISSHTWEHLKNPFEILSKTIKLADKYFVLLLPFQEKELYKELYKEHLHSIDYNFFPISIQDHQLVHYKEIDKLFYEAGGYWAKEQILVVYVNTKNISIDKFSLEQLNNNYFSELKSTKENFENELRSATEKQENKLKIYHGKLELTKEIYKDELKSIKKYYFDNLNVVKGEYEDKLKKEHEDKLFSLKQFSNQYDDELVAVKGEYEDKLKKEHEDKLFSLKQLSSQYDDELVAVKGEYEDKLKKEHEDKVFSLKQQKNHYLDKLRSTEDELNELNIQLNYYKDYVILLQKKHDERISKIKQLETQIKFIKENSSGLKKQLHFKDRSMDEELRDLKKQLIIIANTRPYRIAYVLRRFSHEFLKGDRTDKTHFLKWIYSKLRKKDNAFESKYNALLALTNNLPPTVVCSDPDKNAVNVPVNNVIKITFSQPVKEGNGWIELKKDKEVIPIKKSINNELLVIEPISILNEGMTYALLLHTGCVNDLTGKPLSVDSIIFKTMQKNKIKKQII